MLNKYIQLFKKHILKKFKVLIYFKNFWPFWVFIAAYRFSLVVASGGYSSLAVRRLLVTVASVVAEHGL